MTISTIVRRFGRICRDYGHDSRGNLTMMLGIAAIPVIAAAGMAVDYARISRVHDKMQLIADGATLAAAGAKNLSGTVDQKKAARTAIATNYLSNGMATLTDASLIGSPVVTASTTSVKVTVKAEVKGSLINVLDAIDKGAELGYGNGGNQAGTGGRKFDLEISSEASWNAGVNYICLLALNATDANALEVKGTADIKAKNCSVWDNSASNAGLYQNGNATLMAKQINVVGNYVGSGYTPNPITGATAFADPLAAQFATDYGTAYAAATLRYDGKIGSTTKYAQMTFSAGATTILPGIYRGGIDVTNNRTITMSPGIYFMQNGAQNGSSFSVQSGGIVTATGGVTIIMTDANAASTVTSNSNTRFQIQSGGSLTIKAPAAGSFKGIAIAQHPNSRPDVNKKEDYVIGGGSVNITGIMYFPKQKFYVTGAGNVSTASEYFALVADKIYIEGNGQLNVSQASDFEATGMPALPAAGGGIAKVTLK